MIIVTTLVIPPGSDTGPFNLYTDSDGYTVPFATNVSAAALQAGYSSTVPNDATIVRVVSVGLCTNFINLDINLLPPTTTTTSSSSTSTSTSTTSTSSSTTTTTTTSQLLLCYQAEIYPPIFNPGTFHTVEYLDCYGNPQIINVPDGGTMVTICYTGIVSDNNNGLTNPLFTYCPAPTTTTTTTETPSCFNFTMTALVPENLGFTYVDCFGSPQYVVLNDASLTVCCSTSPTCAAPENKWDVTIEDPCGV
jgi:hypothetical protein